MDYKDDSSDSPGYSDEEFASAAKAAFPNEDWDDERLHAFKELIHMCAEEGEEEEGEDDGDEGGGMGHSPKLALVFGGKPKSKGA